MKINRAIHYGLAAAALFAPFVVRAQSTIIPQIADGGGWQTTLVLTNTSSSSASASLTFFQDTAAGATQSWNPLFLEVSSTQNLPLQGGGTLFLHTAGTAGSTTTGWAQVQGSSAVVAYAIFTERVAGRQDQDGTATASNSATRFLVPFDNTNGFVTAIAIANPNSSSQSISVGIQTSGNAITSPSPINMPANGHMTFALPQQFSATSGQSGLAEFYTSGASISVLALRFNPTGAFTTAPVYAETGPPVIGGATSGGPSGSFPQFDELTFTSSQASIAQSGVAVEGSIVTSDGQHPLLCGGSASGYAPSGKPTLLGTSSFNSYEVNGLTVTCTGLNASSTMVNYADGTVAQITSGSLTFTLNPQTVSTSGTVSGSVSLVSTVGTITSSFTGTYIAH